MCGIGAKIDFLSSRMRISPPYLLWGRSGISNLRGLWVCVFLAGTDSDNALYCTHLYGRLSSCKTFNVRRYNSERREKTSYGFESFDVVEEFADF